MRLFKLLIIPLFLIFIYFILISYPYFFSKINRYDSLGPLSLVEEESINIQETFSSQRRTDQYDNHLLKGDKVSAKLKASENNFGILLVRFSKLSSLVSDRLVFRLKEEGKENWYYEHIYFANQFQHDQYFTFGFPSISNSKNKTYVFEIESLSGTYKNGIGLSQVKPQIALVYKYTRNDLKNYNTLSSFISKKFTYVVNNVNLWQNWQILASLLFSYIFFLFVKRREIMVPKTILFSKKVTHWFTSTKFYLLFLNTNTKKRIAIALLIFLFALMYRFSATLVTREGVSLFYAGLGGQGDYDQFIRAATCAVTNFCAYAVLGQNFLIETSILGVFYKIFGFTEALKAYSYLMLILSSIVATLPYFLLSRKSWITLGGIIGSLYIATSDFLTNVSLNFTPDNGSLFTFSIFFIVYLLTLQKGTIRWLIFFGLIGTFDGFNKALFLINDLAAFALFLPVFFYEKVKGTSRSIFGKKNIKLLFLSSLPLLIFLIIYIAWEYFVYFKFSAHYFLGGILLSKGVSYISYTSLNDSSLSLTGNFISILMYLCVSTIVMLKRLIVYTDLQIIFLVPIFLGLFFFSFISSLLNWIPFRRTKFPVKKFLLMLIFSIFTIFLLISVKNNYFKIHEIFSGEYIFYTWTEQTYIGIFLLLEIIMLFILNFKYSAIKLSLPIIPYVIMIIILTRNSPFPRISTQVVAWIIILLAFIIDWIIINANKYSRKGVRIILGPVFLILFISVYILPKTTTMITQLNLGFAASQNQIRYLRWVEESIPANARILAGGKSDLVTVAENVKRPIIFNTLWSTAVLIRPNEIPDISSSNFNLVRELKNKDNFIKNRYIILEDDIYLWRDRVLGVEDNVFSIKLTTLRADDYSIKVYKFNPILKKSIYELDIR